MKSNLRTIWKFIAKRQCAPRFSVMSRVQGKRLAVIAASVAFTTLGEISTADAQLFLPRQPANQFGQPVVVTPVPVPVQVNRPTLSTQQALIDLASRHEVCMVVGEDFASRYIGSRTVEEGPFQDFVMGAQLSGVQKTNAQTTVDFLADQNAARMLVVLKGQTENDTVAQVRQSAVRSAGVFFFEMTKQVEFNGGTFTTWSPSASISINQRNLGAATPVSNIPLLGPLANNIALNVAEQQKPMSENFAAHRVTQQIAPTFNSRLDESLKGLNESLHGSFRDYLTRSNLLPSKVSPMTTGDAVLVGVEFLPSTTASGANLTGSGPTPRATTKLGTSRLIGFAAHSNTSDQPVIPAGQYSLDGTSLRNRACLMINASLVKNLSERFNLNGRVIPDSQISPLLSGNLNIDSDAKPNLYTVILDQDEPLTAVFDQGEIVLSIKAVIRPVIGSDLPPQIIKIGIVPLVDNGKLHFDSQSRGIFPVNDNEEGRLGEASAAIVEQMIESRLNDYSFNAQYDLNRSQDQSCFTVRITGITLVDNWMTVAVEDVPALAAEAKSEGEILPTLAR
ncbi:hypothetical protein SH668x_001136 [Planctomicrobium sp. SH668]|uniref:hypothetical protein n=1 Tax=Planctomicrobium sp. SH668 TaxID=3448126 RepID=UPI003F5B8F67